MSSLAQSPIGSSRPRRCGRRFLPRLVSLGAFAGALAAAAWTAVQPGEAALSLLLVAGALIVAGAAWLESGPGSSKELALVATLGAAAAAGRILFAAIPNVQPVTVTAVVGGGGGGGRPGGASGGAPAP